eukprot:1997832-Karenia_brevis.AAC.1
MVVRRRDDECDEEYFRRRNAAITSALEAATGSLCYMLHVRQWRYLGHIARMGEQSMARDVLFYRNCA